MSVLATRQIRETINEKVDRIHTPRPIDGRPEIVVAIPIFGRARVRLVAADAADDIRPYAFEQTDRVRYVLLRVHHVHTLADVAEGEAEAAKGFRGYPIP